MATEVDLQAEEEKKAAGVVEYLQAPKKKRKNYCVLALGNTESSIISGIELHIKNNFSAFTTVRPKTESDLVKFFNRQISLLIIDDDFCGIESNMDLVLSLKEKKVDDNVPVLFFTSDPESLIQNYHDQLILYQEVDDYLTHRRMPISQILSRVQEILESGAKSRRKSRRYKTEVHVKFLNLAKDRSIDGVLLDISLHGCVLQTSEQTVFGSRDQILIQIPVAGILPVSWSGEFLPLSAKVQRVYMGGDRAALSWEYISEMQRKNLVTFLTETVNRQLYRKARGRKITAQG
ncbi:MAG: PilZ domain-containing protein [Oligoflexales bacterium]